MNDFNKSLYTMQEVLSEEENAKKCVWVLAPDIALGPQQFKSVMLNNMVKKRIKYKYIVSDDETVQDNLYEFVGDLLQEDIANRFDLRLIPKSIIESDVTIIDPDTPGEKGFILAPCESGDKHYNLQGSALYRIKQRFSILLRISNKIRLDTELQYPIDSNIDTKSFGSLAWNCGLSARGNNLFEMWERLGIKLTLNAKDRVQVDSRRYLLSVLLQKYSIDRDLCPAFNNIQYPQEINDTMRMLIRETLTCHLGAAYSASIGMCGKIMETALRFFIENQSNKETDPNIGLGKLIRLVVEKFGVELDEGLKVLVNFINQFRITGVHSKKGFELPTFEQSQSVVYATYDTLRKLFGK